MKWISANFLFCLMLLAGCLKDADRSNPFDPKSNNFDNTGSLSGRIIRYYSPIAPISDAKVRIEPGPFLAVSNVSGNFQLVDLEPGKYKVPTWKQGYTTYSNSVEISTQQSANIDLNLDGLPVISTFTIRTGRASRWFPTTDVLSLEIMAHITDPDSTSDIDQVRLSIPELNFQETLNMISPGIFSKRYLENNLPGRNLFDLVGYDIEVTTMDNVGYASETVSKQIIRIIGEEPLAVSPLGLQRLSIYRQEVRYSAV